MQWVNQVNYYDNDTINEAHIIGKHDLIFLRIKTMHRCRIYNKKNDNNNDSNNNNNNNNKMVMITITTTTIVVMVIIILVITIIPVLIPNRL